jgi:hypothetical protein
MIIITLIYLVKFELHILLSFPTGEVCKRNILFLGSRIEAHLLFKNKGNKGKVQTATGHEGPEGEKRYSLHFLFENN